MSRVDKYNPKVGGYRATLAADVIEDQLERLYGVGHDAQGRLVIGAGVTGIKAVWVWTKSMKAGKRCDTMTRGEVVEFGPTAGDPGEDFGVPGTNYYSDASGNITATPGGVYVGHTVEGQRLIVDVIAEIPVGGSGEGEGE